MMLVLLVEERFLPIPNTLTIRWVGRYDAILNPTDIWYKGEATEIVGRRMLLDGDKSDFKSWLDKFGGVWVTKSQIELDDDYAEVKWDYVPAD